VEDQGGESIRQQLKVGKLPFGSPERVEDEWCEVVFKFVLQCWQTVPTLRPPSANVAQQLGQVYTRYCASPGVPISLSTPLYDVGNLNIISQRCMQRIEAARKPKVGQGIEKLGAADFQVLVDSTRKEFNPVTHFLVGAAIWWQLSEFNRWDDEFMEAHDLQPDCTYIYPLLPLSPSVLPKLTWGVAIRARRALRYLVPAADSGYRDAGREASKAYAYLANLYRSEYEASRNMQST
jgi:hypothetical protein